MRTPQRAFPKRSAFSLVEMLVVVAIILILLALLAGAVMAMIGVGSQKATETVLEKVATALSGKWTAVSAKAQQDDALTIPAGNDPYSYRTAYASAMQTREFPTTINAAKTGPGTFGIAPNSFYVSYLGAANNSGMTPQLESSVCLYMVLSAGQGGMSFNINNLSPAEVGTAPNGLKYVKDGWGQPVQFSVPNGPAVTSAGPDKIFGTADDITINRMAGQTNVITQ